MARWHSCNILQAGAGARRLWQFDARNGEFKLDREQSLPPEASLPGGVRKTWRSLWQPRLNVAWLPAENVFLRVVHLPAASFEETISMVELQLEKLSPIPVTQLVWSVQPLEQSAADLQTLIVILAERKGVEEYLGQLEGQGFLSDRLELPVLDQLLATQITGDGAWIYPGAWGSSHTALVAWWRDGVLQNLNFINAPPGPERGPALGQQLAQMAWSGELEGWLQSPPTWHLVADEVAAAEWEPLLHEGLGELVTVESPLTAGQLAALTARRAAHADAKSNLLPKEYLVRYRQQFVDRLWMRGLFAIGAIYLVGVAIYFVALGVQQFRTGRVESQVTQLSKTYTNAIQLKARYQVLKDRQELKFAALDCWKALAEQLPDAVTVDSFTFSDGRRLLLSGTAPNDKVDSVLNFSSTLRKAGLQGQALFDPAKGDPLTYKTLPGGSAVSWSFSLELKRVEIQ